MKTLKVISILLAIMTVPALASDSEHHQKMTKKAPQHNKTPGLSGPLKIVENKKVCMVTDRLFNRDQIPTTASGQTYYGCCDMCKERLEKTPSLRTAIDPITKKNVDKAKAVIGAAPGGKVAYFENRANLKKFNQR